jgi:hypothetical protein
MFPNHGIRNGVLVFAVCAAASALQAADMGARVTPGAGGGAEGVVSPRATPPGKPPQRKPKKKTSAPKAKPAHAERWVCPMHDGYFSDHPGRCPKCGMDLVLEKDGDAR